MNKIEHAKQLLNELADLDYLNLSLIEIMANRKKLRKEIEVLTIEMYDAKRNGNQEYNEELYDLREEVIQLRDKMENKTMKFFQKLGKIHTIIGIIALVVIIGATGIKILKEGDSELSRSVKYATQEGITNEDIFNAIDPDSNWFAGTTDDGIEFVEVEFEVSIDLDKDGINELENVTIQWEVNKEKYRFHVISINGAVQNQTVGGLLYSEILERGIRANS